MLLVLRPCIRQFCSIPTYAGRPATAFPQARADQFSGSYLFRLWWCGGNASVLVAARNCMHNFAL